MSEQTLENVAVVVPCYNAGSRVRPVIEGVLQVAKRVIVLDDGCTDGCIDTLDGMPVLIESFASNRGKGHALIAGYRTALADSAVTCVACLDADGQHDPADLPGLYRVFVERHADVLIGAREFTGARVPWASRFGNQLTLALVRLLWKTELPDTQSGFRLLSRPFLEACLPSLKGGRYETELALLAAAVGGGYEVVSSPIQTIYEPGNTTSHFRKVRDSIRIYRTLLRRPKRTPGGDSNTSGDV